MLKELYIIIVFATLLSSCASMGPKTIPVDGFNYNQRISTQEREQLLFNIVRLRYAETPMFINVSSIINQYSRDRRASIEADNMFGAASVTPDISGGWSDKPTITYSPMSGKAFSETMLNSIPPALVFYFIQSGWSASRMLNLTTTHINGVRNSVYTGNYQVAADEDFSKVLQLLEYMQGNSVLAMEIAGEGDAKNVNIFLPTEFSDDTIKATVNKFKQLLKLSPELNRFPIKYGPFQRDAEEIYLQTHSLLEIFLILSNNIEVPPEHIKAGKTYESSNKENLVKIKILSSKEKPENAYVAINNRGYWFYIDDSDWDSKITFGIIQVLLNLSKDSDPSKGPLISIGS
ncbi:hypothetical protein [Maribellus mangrovi]|uniref:hypothetical protein n=1 Tax=Maribellus mangrovi TaxID=3133146 RepID=UPI0030EB7241